ncbi:MAG: sulfatase-like hydrolase/transferase [Spirochaetia bacterium]|nr:sulfatase-like hydrolase/transferase [Spirochaetia bacterium]
MRNKKPNILFIVSDQHNPKIAGFAGNSHIETPTLDKLAEEGVSFSQMYAQCPLSVPSRSSFLTGKYCKSLNIYDNQDILDTDEPTIAKTFSASGYSTCLIGKAHFNGDQYHGYQERPYGDLFGQGHQPDPCRTPDKGEHGLGEIPYQAGPSGIPELLTQTEICTYEAVRWLQGHTSLYPERPFFLSLHYDKPHFPLNPPEDLYKKYKARVTLPSDWEENHTEAVFSSLVPFVQENFISEGFYHASKESHHNALAAYYGCIEWVDRSIGKVLECLNYLNLTEDTIIVYASDHGELAAAHGAWQKMVFYEESVRVPCIVSWKSVIPSGRVVDGLCGLFDLYPTLCSLAGIQPPDHCEGESLDKVILENRRIAEDRIIYSESVLLHKPQFAGCMLRQGKYKYVYYLDGTEELYDLQEDPQEKKNIAEQKGHLAKGFKQSIIDFWQPDMQEQRYHSNPKSVREKHFYPYSNQYCLNGKVADAKP